MNIQRGETAAEQSKRVDVRCFRGNLVMAGFGGREPQKTGAILCEQHAVHAAEGRVALGHRKLGKAVAAVVPRAVPFCYAGGDRDLSQLAAVLECGGTDLRNTVWNFKHTGESGGNSVQRCHIRGIKRTGRSGVHRISCGNGDLFQGGIRSQSRGCGDACCGQTQGAHVVQIAEKGGTDAGDPLRNNNVGNAVSLIPPGSLIFYGGQFSAAGDGQHAIYKGPAYVTAGICAVPDLCVVAVPGGRGPAGCGGEIVQGDVVRNTVESSFFREGGGVTQEIDGSQRTHSLECFSDGGDTGRNG